jgi:hypothetical protein
MLEVGMAALREAIRLDEVDEREAAAVPVPAPAETTVAVRGGE